MSVMEMVNCCSSCESLANGSGSVVGLSELVGVLVRLASERLFLGFVDEGSGEYLFHV
jgi:hypothetical protein